MYQVRLLKSAVHDLERLEKSTSAGILRRINWLAENVESLELKRLAGDLSGLCKLRNGDYRVIYQVLRTEKAIVIHAIGHRRDIYRK